MLIPHAPPCSDDCAECERIRWRASNERLGGLISRAIAGDEEAFGSFYDETAPWLLGVVRRLVGAGDAEDVLAEVYLQVWKQLGTYDAQRSAPGVWLCVVARSRALDHLRLRRRGEAALRLESVLALGDCAGSAGPEQEVSALEMSRLLEAHLAAALTPDERNIIALAYFRELTHLQISGLTGMPLGSVKTLISRAQDKLRVRFADGRPGASTALDAAGGGA